MDHKKMMSFCCFSPQQKHWRKRKGMSGESVGFDQTRVFIEGEDENGDSQSQLQVPNAQSFNDPLTQLAASASGLEMELLHHHPFNLTVDSENGNGVPVHEQMQNQYLYLHNPSVSTDFMQNFHTVVSPDNPFSVPPHLLPPPCSKYSNLSNSLGVLGETSVYDPLNQEAMMRDLLHAGGGGAKIGSFFEGGGGLFQDPNQIANGGETGDFECRLFEFTSGEMDNSRRNGNNTKHLGTEKQRRVAMHDKFEALSKMIPNPTKNDRASVVADAISYIQELKRTVAELKVLADKKRSAKERLKRPKIEADDGMIVGDVNQEDGFTLRSSWLQRKSKHMEIDVRIIDDEVTVKLVQQKRINCLVYVSKILDELHLDLHHVAGGVIGDYYSFLFNSKICEGSIVYASALANKLIEVVDQQYAAAAAAIVHSS